MITVITLLFGNLPYADLTIVNNRKYCKKWGYKFILVKPDSPPLEDRNPIWYKVKRAQHQLLMSDYLLYLDADAYFYNHDKSLEYLIDMLGDSDMLLSTDPPWSNINVNTGAWLVRSCLNSHFILQDWWDVPLTHPNLGHTWPIEQAAFNRVVRPAHTGIKVVEAAVLNGKGSPEDFIRHPCGLPKDMSEKVKTIEKDLDGKSA